MSVTTSTMLGSYRLVAELGHGGMADVYLAVQEGPAGSGFAKLAVVKKLRENLAEDPDFVAMLMDEARITARLAHPNVVQLFEVGQEGDTYFLAIEYLEGQPLHRIGRRAKKERVDVAPDLYYAIVSDVLAGLHHAHELADYDGTPLEVVHRDVTPHNIFVTYEGAVKVVDFGIAKAMGRATETKQGIVKGKVPYMSPEQVSGGRVDRRTDIFAAGIILWNSATGTKLWADLDEVGIVRALCSGRYDASPRAICPGVPEAIDAICRRALAFRPEDRYGTAAEMRADLEAFLGRGGGSARKRLESMMKELFAPERVKLRTVLEAARLTSAVSPGAFAAATAGVKPAEPPRTDSTPPPEHTRVMPGAPLRPDLVAPSVPLAPSAQVVPAGSRRRARVGSPEPLRRSPERTRREVRLAVGGGAALVAAAAIGIVLARGAGPDGDAELGRASSVASERTALDPTVRSKAARPPEVVEVGAPTVTQRGGGARTAGPVAVVKPSRTAEPAPPASSVKPSPRGLDDTDPWRPKSHD